MPNTDNEKKNKPNSLILYELKKPKIIAIAKDSYLTQTYNFPDHTNLPGIATFYGQDITYANGRWAPKDQSVGKSELELIPQMKRLLDIFASGDQSGMSARLFEAFLVKQPQVVFFDDEALNKAAERHENIQAFCGLSLSAPKSGYTSPSKIRIHQALKSANWDINKIGTLVDLGVPAFNSGSKIARTGDFDNGLGIMVNGIQHAYVIAKSYHYNKEENHYQIGLDFIFYDVFGLDDDDLNEYGAPSTDILSFSSEASRGITAWWQLQHQFGYPPLVTRIKIEKTLQVSTL